MLEKEDNIINFPVERRMAEIDKEAAREEFYINSNNYDDWVALARYCIDLLNVGLQEQDFIDFDLDKRPGFHRGILAETDRSFEDINSWEKFTDKMKE